MPIHDWTRVPAGTFHHFHATWIPLLAIELNRGVLPKGYYALAEQVAGGISPDVLTLQEDRTAAETDGEGGTAVATRPPQVAITAVMERRQYAAKANRLVIRHSLKDRIVGLMEVVSPGNKASRRDLDQFLMKSCEALEQGIHLLIIDLYPPTKRDPQGMHGLIWEEMGEGDYVAPPNKPLTLASYVGMPDLRAYVQPAAVGERISPMPLFLSSARYVEVPLENSYMEAVSAIPDRARSPLEQ